MKRVAAIVVGVVLVTLSSASVLRAAVLLVGDGTPASCTQVALETALAAAGAGGGDIIRFRCGAVPATITIDAALTIPTKTTIDGEGLVSLQGQGPDGDFTTVPAHTSVVLENLAIRTLVGVAIIVEGTLTVTHITFSSHFGEQILNKGTLIVKDSTFTGSLFGPVIENDGTLTVQGSSFFNNDAVISNRGTGEVVRCVFSGNGGHEANTIANLEGSLTVRDSVFSHNVSAAGGAIDNDATLDINGSTFFDNSALFSGGAIFNVGALTLRNSQLIDNVAGTLNSPEFGGGVFNQSSQDVLIDRTFLVGNSAPSGGGIAQAGTGTLTINNSFVLANTATDGAGGGIYVRAGSPSPTLKRTTVTNNTPNDIGFQLQP